MRPIEFSKDGNINNFMHRDFYSSAFDFTSQGDVIADNSKFHHEAIGEIKF